MHISIRPIFVLQVQDIEFAQIEMKVIEGLKVGNDCLKKMHEVRNENYCYSWSCSVQRTGEFGLYSHISIIFFFSNQMLSIEEVERIMDETHDAIEYQKVHFTFSLVRLV